MQTVHYNRIQDSYTINIFNSYIKSIDEIYIFLY